jgi:hypothetical protein
MQPDLSHLVVHNVSDSPQVNVAGDPNVTGNERWTLDPAEVSVDQGGVLGRLVWPDRITDDGFSICDDARVSVDRRRAGFADATARIHA